MLKKMLLLNLLLLALCRGDITLEKEFDWDTNGKEYCTGIKLAYLELNEPRILKINAARIEIKNPKIDFVVAQKDKNAGQPIKDAPKYTICTRRQTVRAFMENVRRPVEKGGLGLNMVLGVNTTGWSPWPPPNGNVYAGNLGLVVSNGNLISPPRAKRPAFAILKDRSCKMLVQEKEMDISNIYYAVSGFAIVLTEGECTGDTALHPRTGFGISQDGKYMLIVVIDGRQKDYSEGCTTKEVAQLLKHFGAWNGMNMDGGGSSTLMILNENKLPKILNHHLGGYERDIACPFGFILKEEATTK
ncbi:MAG: phosphodiester glycosidase family protein [Victivallales bacterium]|nr:phosphodiester glycosidase family protein [Victivallales bacterium]